MTQREHPSGDPHLAQFLGRQQQRPLIGRDDERAALRKLLLETEARLQDTAAASAPGEHLLAARLPCVILQGEPGIGKTRLAEEMSLEALERDWTVVWSSLYAQESTIPYRLWTQVLQHIVRQDLLPQSELEVHAAHYLPLTSLLPEMIEMLPANVFPPIIAPELGQENLRLWEAARTMLLSICEQIPLLLVLDDLHCADESSCELLGYLVRQLAGYPVMLLGTYRQNELPLAHPLSQLFGNLHRERLITVLTVPALTEAQIGLLVADVPEPLLQQIQQQAAGNPLFAEELARVLPTLSAQDRAEGLLSSRSRRLTLTQTITAVFDQRLRRLSQDCQLLLGNAAVLGGSFSFSALMLMEMSSDGGFDEEALYTLLEEALRAKVLTEKPDGADALYHFWHPLLMSHLYEKLSASRRVALHRRAAEVIGTLYAARASEGAASIAYHLLQGNAPAQQIIYYAELAASHAYSLSAYPEAERYYRLVLKYMDESSSNTACDPLRRAYILEVLGECTRIQGKSEDARAFYEEALELRCREGWSSSREEMRQMAQIRSLIVCEIGVTWYNIGDSTRALLCYERSEQYLREAQITSGPAWATIRFLQSYSSWREGDYEGARRMASEALTLFEETLNAPLLAVLPVDTPACSARIRRILAGDPVDLGRTHALLGMVASTVGQPATAIQHLNKALELYKQQQSQREMAMVYCTLSDLHLKKAEHVEANAALHRSLELAQRIGDVPLIAVIYANLGLLASRTGNLTEAEMHYKRGFALAEQVSDPVYTSMFLVHLAPVLHDLGRASEAVATLCRALTIGRARHFAPCIGFALIGLGAIRSAQSTRCTYQERMRLLMRARRTLTRALALEGLEVEMKIEGQMTLAQVMLDQGEREEALQLVLEALKEAQECELVWLIVRTRRVLGNVLVALGRQQEAHQSFQQALTQCREHGMRLELARTLHCYAEALLRVDSASEQRMSYVNEAHMLFLECNIALDREKASCMP